MTLKITRVRYSKVHFQCMSCYYNMYEHQLSRAVEAGMGVGGSWDEGVGVYRGWPPD